MKIDQMVKREDFFSIFENTVRRYYKETQGKDITFSYSPFKNGKKIVINGKFNFVATYRRNHGVLEFLKSEFNIRNSKIKFIIGRIATYLAYYFPFIGKARDAYISDNVLDGNKFISPQNRSIRFFDYDSMTVDCIIKDSFTDRYFKNQIDFRKKYNYEFMLPMLSYGENWFREPILEGHPLARTTNEADHKKGFDDAFRYIKALASDTKSISDGQEYVGHLKNKIVHLLNQAKEKKAINNIDEITAFVNTVVQRAEKIHSVPLAMTHGDLQEGNIWITSDKKTIIYDWETADTRSIWYDFSVLGYSLRRVYGLNDFMQNQNIELSLFADENKNYEKDEITAIKNIVLLEDIIFSLEDMIELPDTWGREIFLAYMDRISKLRS